MSPDNRIVEVACALIEGPGGVLCAQRGPSMTLPGAWEYRANGAVAAVKKGCQLYKDIKGAAGDVKAVLKDLDDQFHNAYEAKGKTAPPEAKKQLIEEKARVKELNARDGETMGIYQEIGEHLGTYYDNLNKCMAVFEEE
ncbi:MAG: hypothetical protein EBZ67_06020, partial [Chitinophagia bacterium]|nr:hypothetical protein [Chitinophagia bacterium]